MTCAIHQPIIITHAINENGHWHKSHSVFRHQLRISIDYNKRTTAYSDKKELKRGEREQNRETGKEAEESKKDNKKDVLMYAVCVTPQKPTSAQWSSLSWC